MTIDEAIQNREECLKYLEGLGQKASQQNVEAVHWSVRALKALRPVSREQVEKVWRAHWIRCEDAQEGVVKYVCSHCFDYHAFREDFGEYTHNGNHPFCRKCGKAMTDEAVEMVMERLEALNDAGNQ